MRFLAAVLAATLLGGCVGLYLDALDQERRQQYVATNRHLLDWQTASAIEKGEVFVGMRADHARASWGEPYRVNSTILAGRRTEQWVYVYATDGVPWGYLYVENGLVTAIQKTE